MSPSSHDERTLFAVCLRALELSEAERAAEEARPLEAVVAERLVQSLLTQVTKEKELATARTRRARPRWRSLVVGVAFAAAGVAVIAMGPEQARVLPEYTLRVAGSQRILGKEGPLQSTIALTSDSILQVELRPMHRLTESVSVQAFLSSGGALRPWAVALQSAGAGVFWLKQPLRQLPDLHSGSYEMIFAIGTEGHQRLGTEALQNSRRSIIGGWQIVRQRVEVTPN